MLFLICALIMALALCWSGYNTAQEAQGYDTGYPFGYWIFWNIWNVGFLVFDLVFAFK